jgi:hypothetical protein
VALTFSENELTTGRSNGSGTFEAPSWSGNLFEAAVLSNPEIEADEPEDQSPDPALITVPRRTYARVRRGERMAPKSRQPRPVSGRPWDRAARRLTALVLLIGVSGLVIVIVAGALAGGRVASVTRAASGSPRANPSGVEGIGRVFPQQVGTPAAVRHDHRARQHQPARPRAGRNAHHATAPPRRSRWSRPPRRAEASPRSSVPATVPPAAAPSQASSGSPAPPPPGAVAPVPVPATAPTQHDSPPPAATRTGAGHNQFQL